jgi:iron(III) transport system permease protein
MASVGAAPGGVLVGPAIEARRRLELQLSFAAVMFTVVLAVVALLVVFPVALLLLDSFQVGQFGTQTRFGLENWTQALSSPKIWAALQNTVWLALTRQAIAVLIGILIAWLLARTDIPARQWLEFGFWISVFLPTLTVTLGWIMVFDGFNGLANRLVERLFGVKGPFEIFSWWGIIWVHLVTTTLPIKVMLLTPAFRNMDACLEEAARLSGASTLGTLFRVVVPLVAPTIGVVTVLGMIRSLEAFEIEMVLGLPARIDVYSTLIYGEATAAPPQYGQATVLSVLMLAIILPFIAFQQWYSGRRSHATVTGKFRSQSQPLGIWRWPLFALVAVMLVIMTVLPIGLVMVGAFMRPFGMFEVKDVWTLQNWQTVLGSPNFVDAFKNSLIIAGGTAVFSMIAFSLIAYIIVRTSFYGRGALDFLVWLPSTLPGILLGLGYLFLFLGTPFLRPIYGTTFILVLVASLGSITLTTQLLKSNLLQLGAELEEASSVSGGSRWRTLLHVTLPLLAPSLAVVGVLAFSAAARATSHVALLATRANQPLSILQLNLMTNSDFEAGSVVGIFILILTVGVAATARFLGLRLRHDVG